MTFIQNLLSFCCVLSKLANGSEGLGLRGHPLNYFRVKVLSPEKSGRCRRKIFLDKRSEVRLDFVSFVLGLRVGSSSTACLGKTETF